MKGPELYLDLFTSLAVSGEAAADGSEGPSWCASPNLWKPLPPQLRASLLPRVELLLLAVRRAIWAGQAFDASFRNAGSSGKVC